MAYRHASSIGAGDAEGKGEADHVLLKIVPNASQTEGATEELPIDY